MASPLLLLLRVWLYRRRTQPLPTSGVFFQATQDIFSFCYPHGKQDLAGKKEECKLDHPLALCEVEFEP